MWLTAHRDCAQPRFWPWLITAVTGTWALMDDGDPLKGLLLAAFTLMSLGLVRPYWCTLAVFFVVLGAMHFRSARSRKSVKKFEHTNLTRWLVIAPVKTAMQIFVFVGGVGEYNTIVFAVVAVLIVERAVGACVVQWLFRAKHEACSLPASTAVDALMLTVVSVFFALNVPFNWFVWPLYLCWLVYSVPLVEATKT